MKFLGQAYEQACGHKGVQGRAMWIGKNYSPEYMNEMLRMSAEHYGAENETTERRFIQHQYFENPAGKAVIHLAIAEDNRTVAGQYVLCPMRFFVDQQVRPCVNSLNTLTRTEYRKRGIFTGLAEAAYQQASEEGYTFCYGVPNPNSYPGFIKKLSFVELGRIPLLLRPLRPSQMIVEYLNLKVLNALAHPADLLFRIRKDTENPADIVPINRSNAALLDKFWSNIKNKYPIMNIRDESYISFRYLDMPYREYTLYLAVQNGEPIGFAAGRIMDVAGMRCGMLADFLFVRGYEYAAEKLLMRLLYTMQENGASLAGCLMLKHTEESSLLKRKGFFPCPQKLVPQPFPLLVRTFDRKLGKRICALQDWFFTMGDYDVI